MKVWAWSYLKCYGVGNEIRKTEDVIRAIKNLFLFFIMGMCCIKWCTSGDELSVFVLAQQMVVPFFFRPNTTTITSQNLQDSSYSDSLKKICYRQLLHHVSCHCFNHTFLDFPSISDTIMEMFDFLAENK